MMKYMIVSHFLTIAAPLLAQTDFDIVSDKLRGTDTLYLNFCMSSGEFGRAHEAILLYKKAGVIHAKHVLYSFGVSYDGNMIVIDPKTIPIPLVADSIGDFYFRNKSKYFLLRREWQVTKKQLQVILTYVHELQKFIPRGNSNAPDYYSILTGQTGLIKIDTAGNWNRLSRLRADLGLNESASMEKRKSK